MEKWKSINNYEGYYEVSNWGNVRSLSRDIVKSNGVIQHRNGKLKSLMEDVDGYLVVNLCKDGICRRIPVHRLVAEAFISSEISGLEINHIDCDRKNNHADNLEILTRQENIKYCFLCGNHVSQTRDHTGENNPNYKNRALHNKYKLDKN